MILEAISYSLFVSLYSIIVDIHYALKALKSYKANIVLFIHQEAAKNIDSENTKTGT